MKNNLKLCLILVILAVIFIPLTVLMSLPDGDLANEKMRDIKSQGMENDMMTMNSNSFAFDFYKQISGSNENIFFSPVSIELVFAILYEGADGQTAMQMQELFGFEPNEEKRLELYKNKINALNQDDPTFSLDVSNAIWMTEMYDLNPEYVEKLKTNYHTQTQNVNFVTDDGVNKINQWVSQTTNGKIPQLFEKGDTSVLTLMVATNTIYFNAKWQDEFHPGVNVERDFHLDSENKTKTVMMYKKFNTYQYMKNDILEMMELPYKGDKASMFILLPSEKHQIKKLEENFTLDNYESWKSQMEEKNTAIYLPKFSLETEINLKEKLTKMGLVLPFEAYNADFGKMADYDDIFISKAIQKAAVDVNEKGTEAAAATGAIAQFQSGPPYTFDVNQPFIYIIEDKQTQEILFIGKLVDPRK